MLEFTNFTFIYTHTSLLEFTIFTLISTHIIEAIISPPSGPLLLILLGILMFRPYRRWGYGLLTVGVLSLYLSALPAVNTLLYSFVEQHPPLSPQQVVENEAGAIVALGGGRYPEAPEYGGDTADAFGVERLRYAAHLYRIAHRPIAVVGGDPLETGVSEAQMMKRVLEEEFGVPVPYSEGRSTNTFDNARFAAELLQPQGIDHILLVTHAWHLPRASRAFEKAGFTVTPAPTSFYRSSPLERGFAAFIPNATAMVHTRRVLHELIGMIWYRLSIEQDGNN